MNTTNIDTALRWNLAEKLSGTNKRLALLDVDGTLTTEKSIWQLLMEEIGCWEPSGRTNLERYLRGDIGYTEFCRLDGVLFERQRYSRLVNIAARVPKRPGLDEFFAALAEANFDVALISSGLRLLVNYFTERYQIAIFAVNDLESLGDMCTGKVIIEVPDGQKGDVASRIIDSVSPDFVLSVGDSSGDLPLFELADFSIAVSCADHKLHRAASFRVADGDLSVIARLLEIANRIAHESKGSDQLIAPVEASE
jgi:HAD superfamily phosphoserine phosphatase-like hydrolase